MSRYLIKRGENRVFLWTENLASRPDMLECDKDGNISQAAYGSKEDQSEAISHLKAENSRLAAEVESLRKAIQSRDETIQDLNARLGSVGVGLSVPETTDFSQTATEAAEARPDEVSVEKVVEAIGLLEEGNKEHFTTTGLPRVEALEGLLDAAIDMETRNKAWDIYREKAAA